ncbi:MAG: hypothetical protein ACOZB3_05600 [Calditrichota bacterium]
MHHFRFLLPALLLLIGTTDTFALKLAPYINYSFQMDVVLPHFGFKNIKDPVGTRHEFGLFGWRYEAGAVTGTSQIYMGYHYGASRVYGPGDDELGTRRDSWRDKWLLLGYRYRPLLKRSAKLEPVAGIALTYGQSKTQWTDYWCENCSSIERVSDPSVGVMIEFGVIARFGLPVEFVFLAQGHRYEAHFPHEAVYSGPDHYVVLAPSWQIGAQYVFPTIHWK